MLHLCFCFFCLLLNLFYSGIVQRKDTLPCWGFSCRDTADCNKIMVYLSHAQQNLFYYFLKYLGNVDEASRGKHDTKIVPFDYKSDSWPPAEL